MRSHKFTIQLEVCPEDAEGPTEWFPQISKADALIFLDREIARSEGHLEHVKKMRALVEAAQKRSEENGT